jgi:hypothetical protein
MKKSNVIVAIVVVVLIILGIFIFGGKDSTPTSNNPQTNGNASSTPVVPVVETTKISGKTSQYHNAELGFSVNYPTTWEANNTDTGVFFIMPIDQSQVSTVAKLESKIVVYSGKCSFPPVTTVKDRGTLTVNANTLNMISMSNTVQGRAYFDRMYSLQKGSVCYLFLFSSITQSTTSKNLKGSDLTQAQNNNKAIVNVADSAFTDMVKSFTFVTGPAGVDETKVSPAK